MIDTYLPGRGGDVYAVGRWLDDTEATLAQLASDTASLAKNELGFEGRTQDAFQGLMTAAAQPVSEARHRAGAMREIVKAYAGRLERTQEALARELTFAGDCELTVDGMLIHPPPPRARPTALEPGSIEEAEWTAHENRVVAYNAILDEVVRLRADLDDWIRAHLDAVPAMADRLSSLVKDIGETAESEVRQRAWTRSKAQAEEGARRAEAAVWRTEHLHREDPDYQRRVTEVREERLRSQEHLDASERRQGYLDTVGKVARPLEIAQALEDGRLGELAAESLGGAAGGAVAGGLLVGSGLLVGTGGVALGAVVGGALGVWAYEELVPLHVREALDSGPRGLWDTIF